MIASLRDDKRFPSNPDVVNILQNFDAPHNFHSNYGQRLTAYLQVILLTCIDEIYPEEMVFSRKTRLQEIISTTFLCGNAIIRTDFHVYQFS